MQVTRANSDFSKRVGIAEYLIKIRSSPLLKTMKKFIRSKMDHIKMTNGSAPDFPSPPNIHAGAALARSKVIPPLPLEPPPTDEDYILQIKQEIVDSDYESCSNEGTPSEKQNEPPINCENTTSEESEKSKVSICRDYVMGTCKRPGTFIYAHKYDLTQLVGVYTFCRNYQTSVCTHPNCKYVHATVFEEHHFYRTGILPPHALTHQKKVNVMQPPPPAPPPKDPPANLSVNTNVSTNLTFTNPPLHLQNEIFQEDVRNMVPPNKSATLKKQWNSIEQFGSSPSDRDSNETFAIKCKHCDIMDFRLQYNKDKVEEMLHANENLSNKICMLEKKSEKLCTLISALVTLPSKTESHNNGLRSSLSYVKDQTLLEQLKNIVNVTNRLSTLGEEK